MEKYYFVPVAWKMYGRIGVKADSPKKAMEFLDNHLNDFNLPSDGDYLTDSIEVDWDGTIFDEDGNDFVLD